MRAQNFIYFALVSGFFMGISFSLIQNFDILNLIFATFIITLIFYIIALGSVAFFIKFYDLKKRMFLNVEEIEQVIGVQVNQLEEVENFIFESYKFIKQIEQEELEFLRKKR